MADQRKIIINQLHELNILLLHSKLKATRARTARRAAATVRNVDAARRGRPLTAPHQGADRIGPAHVRLPESR